MLPNTNQTNYQGTEKKSDKLPPIHLPSITKQKKRSLSNMDSLFRKPDQSAQLPEIKPTNEKSKRYGNKLSRANSKFQKEKYSDTDFQFDCKQIKKLPNRSEISSEIKNKELKIELPLENIQNTKKESSTSLITKTKKALPKTEITEYEKWIKEIELQILVDQYSAKNIFNFLTFFPTIKSFNNNPTSNKKYNIELTLKVIKAELFEINPKNITLKSLANELFTVENNLKQSLSLKEYLDNSINVINKVREKLTSKNIIDIFDDPNREQVLTEIRDNYNPSSYKNNPTENLSREFVSSIILDVVKIRLNKTHLKK